MLTVVTNYILISALLERGLARSVSSSTGRNSLPTIPESTEEELDSPPPTPPELDDLPPPPPELMNSVTLSDDAFNAMQADISFLKRRVNILEQQSRAHSEVTAVDTNKCVRRNKMWQFAITLKVSQNDGKSPMRETERSICFELLDPELTISYLLKCGELFKLDIEGSSFKEKKRIEEAREHFSGIDPLNHLTERDLKEVQSLFPIAKDDHRRCEALFDFMAIHPPPTKEEGYDWISDYFFEAAQYGDAKINEWHTQHGTRLRSEKRLSTLSSRRSSSGSTASFKLRH